MTRLLVGTDGPTTSERLRPYLESVLGPDDEVYVLNSLVGGDDTTPDDVEAGEEAIEILEEALADQTSIEAHQMVRGNAPIEDFLAVAGDWDPDEYVIGIRKRSPVGKMVFGSTAQNLLIEADRPVRCVPLVSD